MKLPEYEILEDSAEQIITAWPDFRPELVVMLGSGWGPIAEIFTAQDSISYKEIAALGASGVAGHAGKLTRADFAGHDIIVFQGRRHWYELLDIGPIVFPVFLAKKLGVKKAFLTNAAGGVRSDLAPGSIMLISDHINLMGFNPLTGPAHPIWGERFPDMSEVYSRKLITTFQETAIENDLQIPEGVYCAFSGPSYETPAEIHMAKIIGADAVGMSTVPSAILAQAAGMEVIGLSCITNLAAGISPTPLSHREVIEVSAVAIREIQATAHDFFQKTLQ